MWISILPIRQIHPLDDAERNGVRTDPVSSSNQEHDSPEPRRGQAEVTTTPNANALRAKIRARPSDCEKIRSLVILSESKNLSFFCFLALTVEERFFASLRMTK